ncbi:MAG: D-ribose pyranase [Chloroflexota bacterium]
MKKSALINSEMSHVIASLGHTDMLVVADAGLPIPSAAQRIDLALTQGIPSFIDTVRVILQEMHVEQAFVSEDVVTVSPRIYEAICTLLGDVPVKSIPHHDFKAMTASAKAIVRTGEFTPYANVILVAGAWGFGL